MSIALGLVTEKNMPVKNVEPVTLDVSVVVIVKHAQIPLVS